jgi:hypothetical protein
MATSVQGGLRIAGIAILIVSIVMQTLCLAVLLFDYDPRTSCDRLSYWSEWIPCMHGRSHLHIVVAEIVIFGWVLGGVASVLGRLAPPYISVIVPALTAALIGWFAIAHWSERVVPYANFGVPTLVDSLVFILDVCVFAFVVAGPTFGAWLVGLHSRAERRSFQASTLG